MSELEKENQELTKGNQGIDQDVDLGRRKLAKIGAAAPVIMTLASKPVFGAQCLSQMMSGNASADVTGSCALGTSPGGLSKLQGTIVNGDSVASAWAKAGFKYADIFTAGSTYTDLAWRCTNPKDKDYDDSNSIAGTNGFRLKKEVGSKNNKQPGNPQKPGHYIGGTNVEDVSALGFNFGGCGNPPIRLVLNNANKYKDQVLRHVLAAYINAFSVTGYALTPDQVIGLYNGTIPIPGGLSLVDFLDTTWELPAHSH